MAMVRWPILNSVVSAEYCSKSKVLVENNAFYIQYIEFPDLIQKGFPDFREAFSEIPHSTSFLLFGLKVDII